MGAFILNRLREPSTWRGLLTLATVLGVALTPDQAESIALAGAALVGAVGAFMPDRLPAATVSSSVQSVSATRDEQRERRPGFDL